MIKKDNAWERHRLLERGGSLATCFYWLPTIAVLVSVFTAVAQGRHAAPFSLLLRATHSTVRVGSPVDVDLTTTNNLSRPITLTKSNPGMEYQIQVQDSHGQPVQQTAVYKQLQNPAFVFRLTTQVLQPQQSSTETFDLAKFFDLSKPETYSIQVQRPLPRQLGKGSIKSNTVIVTTTAIK